MESNHTYPFSSYLTTAESMLVTVPSGVTEVVVIESACVVTNVSTDNESTVVSDLEEPHADKPTIVATKANANTFFIFNCLVVLLNNFMQYTKLFTKLQV